MQEQAKTRTAIVPQPKLKLMRKRGEPFVFMSILHFDCRLFIPAAHLFFTAMRAHQPDVTFASTSHASTGHASTSHQLTIN
jgi:hypothetical protein